MSWRSRLAASRPCARPWAWLRILAQQQLQRAVGLPQAAGGVQAGPDLKSHVVGLHRRLDPRHVQQGTEPGPGGFTQPAKSVAGQSAVLPDQGHDIGDGAQGHQIQVLLQSPRPGPETLPWSRPDLTRAWQNLKATPTPARWRVASSSAQLGIDQGHRFGEFSAGLVVVGHDHRHPLGLRPGHGRGRVGAAVHGDDQARAKRSARSHRDAGSVKP